MAESKLNKFEISRFENYYFYLLFFDTEKHRFEVSNGKQQVYCDRDGNIWITGDVYNKKALFKLKKDAVKERNRLNKSF